MSGDTAAEELPVRSLGSGPPALLIHGFTGSGLAWPEACLHGVAPHRRLLVPDLPGHGAADGPAAPEAYRVTAVLDALTAILDRASAERALWMGYSMGGRIALAAAVLRPERVEALVLESASPGLATPAERAARRHRDDRLARLILARGVPAFVDAWMSQPIFATQLALSEATRETERSRRLGNDPTALAACLRGLGTGAQPSFWDRLSGITAPTLVLTGALDRKFTDIGRQLATAIPNAVHEPVPDAGHAVHLERPERWVECVTRFLGRLAQAGGTPQDSTHPHLGRPGPAM